MGARATGKCDTANAVPVQALGTRLPKDGMAAVRSTGCCMLSSSTSTQNPRAGTAGSSQTKCLPINEIMKEETRPRREFIYAVRDFLRETRQARLDGELSRNSARGGGTEQRCVRLRRDEARETTVTKSALCSVNGRSLQAFATARSLTLLSFTYFAVIFLFSCLFCFACFCVVFVVCAFCSSGGWVPKAFPHRDRH